MVRLHTFGGCFLERDGRRLDALSGQRKSLALLALLAVAGPRGASRETVLAFLWPQSDEERARTSLRQLVHGVRAQLAAPELLLPSADLRLNPAVAGSDVGDFGAAVAAARHDAAVALHVGPFLDGFYLRGADDLERWIATQRGSFARQRARSLEALARAADASGDVRGAADWWRRLAEVEPLSAGAATGLMRALDTAGERAAAVEHARVHERAVREGVGGAPDPAVTALAAALRDAGPADRLPPAASPLSRPVSLSTSAGPPAAAAPAPAVAPRRGRRARLLALAAAAVALAGLGTAYTVHRRVALPSVAVLPFVNTGGNPADEPLSDGLTDELIGTLGRVGGFRVVGRTSAFALEGRGLGAEGAATALGVATVVEGSVLRVGDRLRVGVQLVRARDNIVLWAGRYDRPASDMLAVQEEIARAVVGAMRVTLGGAAEARLVRRPTADPTAYDLYLRGRHIFVSRTDREGVAQAARYFEQAVARDPGYARAYAGLADVHVRRAAFGMGPPPVELALAKEAARRALTLDSTLAEAHAALAHARCTADFDWRGAERDFRRAITADPGYAFARVPFAICLQAEGRVAEAIAQLDSARAVDPLAPAVSNVLGRVYVSAGQPDRAIGYLREALELSPGMDLAYQQLGHAYLQKGMHQEAIAALGQAAALSGPRDSAQLAYALATAGRRAEARAVLDGLMDPSRPGRPLPYHVAMAYAGLGDRDAAFRWLERGQEERASFMVGVKAEPGFAALHGDPRWPRLLGRMGLSPE